jgi:hypothetical protein
VERELITTDEEDVQDGRRAAASRSAASGRTQKEKNLYGRRLAPLLIRAIRVIYVFNFSFPNGGPVEPDGDLGNKNDF